MSLLPLIFRDMMQMSRPLRMLENHLRLTEEMLKPFVAPAIRVRWLPALEHQEQKENIIQDKEKFMIKLDVQDFAPEEITVKTLDGNTIQIEAKHEKKEEDGFISKQLIRKFVLSKDHDLKDVISSLSSDGILTVTAPKKAIPNSEETIIKINHTGPEREDEDKQKSEK
ncbi:heat shock protein hsp-12.2-related [Holotrichia oblita]|uniref:Heat shock protein hsp-12.2-related n=1 Tax=Holotrichia oblita TaxID=644536 RepID=A0ACB9TWJ0_HOLOL|nr:heat shock protein hsp-12.2-related [Holotrichia oblita]